MIPDGPELVAYAEALFASGELKAAASVFEQADPTAGDARLTARLATCYLHAGEPARAIERLERGAASHGWASGSW